MVNKILVVILEVEGTVGGMVMSALRGFLSGLSQ